MGSSAWRMMFPVSILSSMKKVVAPVRVSPLIMAQLIGAAPRYWGRREAWRLKVPKLGISHTCLGSILKATTTCKLASKALSSSRNPLSFRLVGCNNSSSLCRANSFTAEYCSLRPRPAGRSGAVITPTTCSPASRMACRLPTAKSGVPMNTMRSGLFLEAVLIVCIYLDFIVGQHSLQYFSQNLFIGLRGLCQNPFSTRGQLQQAQDPFLQLRYGRLLFPFVANIAASALFGAVFPEIIQEQLVPALLFVLDISQH